MINKAQLGESEAKIQSALGMFLRQRENWGDPSKHENHIDDDMITAFVEGNLSEREAKPVVSHLVDCSYCLHVSSELIKLESALVDEPAPVHAVAEESTGVGHVLSSILGKIFGNADSAVFAHEEKAEEDSTDDSEE